MTGVHSRASHSAMVRWVWRRIDVVRRGDGRKERDEFEKESIKIPSSTTVEVNLTR
jgi:hypothetical protein